MPARAPSAMRHKLDIKVFISKGDDFFTAATVGSPRFIV